MITEVQKPWVDFKTPTQKTTNKLRNANATRYGLFESLLPLHLFDWGHSANLLHRNRPYEDRGYRFDVFYGQALDILVGCRWSCRCPNTIEKHEAEPCVEYKFWMFSHSTVVPSKNTDRALICTKKRTKFENKKYFLTITGFEPFTRATKRFGTARTV